MTNSIILNDSYAKMSSKTFEYSYYNIGWSSKPLYREYLDLIRRCRTLMLKEERFAGTVSMSMDYIIAESYNGMKIDTACTDGRLVIFSPKYIEEKLFVEIKATNEHEVWHIALAHPFRVQGRDHQLCNIAGDYSVNGIMYERYPEIIDWDWLYDDKLSKMSMEAVYEIIKKEHETGGNSGQGKHYPNEKEGDSSNSESKDKEHKDWKSAEHGQFTEIKNNDGNKLSKEEFQNEISKHKDFINITKSVCKNAGSSFGNESERQIDKVTSPKLNWKISISRFVSKNGKRAGLNPMKYCRQKIKHGIYYPETLKKGKLNLGMGFDVSSSMDRESLNLLASCMDDIRVMYNVETITIVPFNTRVIKSSITKVKKGEKIPKSFSGWGGTSFAPVFKWFNEQEEKPDMVIIFTDLGSRDYGDKPNYPVMWASSYPVVEYTSYTNKPPFGDVVEIEPPITINDSQQRELY
jgi:predicted metal-dependent peptidase